MPRPPSQKTTSLVPTNQLECSLVRRKPCGGIRCNRTLWTISRPLHHSSITPPPGGHCLKSPKNPNCSMVEQLQVEVLLSSRPQSIFSASRNLTSILGFLGCESALRKQQKCIAVGGEVGVLKITACPIKRASRFIPPPFHGSLYSTAPMCSTSHSTIASVFF